MPIPARLYLFAAFAWLALATLAASPIAVAVLAARVCS